MIEPKKTAIEEISFSIILHTSIYARYNINENVAIKGSKFGRNFFSKMSVHLNFLLQLFGFLQRRDKF